MMSFAAEFPVEQSRSPRDFLSAVKTWILGSHHTNLTARDLATFEDAEDVTFSSTTERMEVLRTCAASNDAVAVRYTKIDPRLEWVTSIIFSRADGDAWIGIRISCESQHPASHLSPAKKPILVRTFLDALGGGHDGILLVQSRPIRLQEADVDAAARCIAGRARCRMPVVYVSSGFGGGYSVDPDLLADALSGMAHVVVEPSRIFSTRLKLEVGSQNVYGGTIGIYWPDGGGRASFFLGPSFASEEDLRAGIIEEVRVALSNRRPFPRCTWASVQEAVARRTYLALKDAGSTEVEKYITEFDKEISAKDEQLHETEKEIARLRAEVRRYESRIPVGAGLSFETGSEQDLYEGEIKEIICDSLKDGLGRAASESRRLHVLKAICDGNLSSDVLKRSRDRLKVLLRGYRGMDSRIEQGLRDLNNSTQYRK